MTHPLVERIARHAGALIGLLLFTFALFAIRALLRDVDTREIVQAVSGIAGTTLGLSALCVAGSYAFLIGYDASALRYVARSVPVPVMIVGSFSAYALGNTVGLAVLSGGAVRHRFYHRFGLSLRDVTVVSTFCAVAFGVSVSLVGLAALIGFPGLLRQLVPLPDEAIRLSGAVALTACLSLLAFGSLRARPIGLGRWRVRMPAPPVLLAQVGYSLGELTLAALALYLLLPAGTDTGFLRFVCLFAAASLAAALSHVPGGVGVFDGLLIAGLSAGGQPVPEAAAAVLVFRAVYYLGPFLLSIVLLCVAGPWLATFEPAGGAAPD